MVKSGKDMRKSIALFLACFVLLTANFAMAWGGAGHEVIAAEAYQQLSPEQKAEVFEVLKAHPDYPRWANSYHPNASFDLPAYVFMRSSTWPDEIRRSGSIYDHPNWHFIDYPLRPPDFPMLPGHTPDNDVLFGVAQSERVLSDIKANVELRAAMLSYLIHLVGDMHQPLHCESLFSAAYPTGDRGGNDFYIMPGNRVVGLHGIWDGLLGTSANPRTQWNHAIELEAKYPRASLPELAADTTPKSWSLESRALAIEKGYLHGKLIGSTERDSAPKLPPDYLKNAKLVAEKQGALAGYRLADEISKYLKYAGPVPLLPTNMFVATAKTLPTRIGTLEASKYYDETMTVTGKVEQVSVRSTVKILDVDGSGRAAPFTAVIFSANAGAFGDVERFNNQSVEIKGTITEYRNKPEIILESPGQIKVVDGK
jgi:hypothetical protein